MVTRAGEAGTQTDSRALLTTRVNPSHVDKEEREHVIFGVIFPSRSPHGRVWVTLTFSVLVGDVWPPLRCWVAVCGVETGRNSPRLPPRITVSCLQGVWRHLLPPRATKPSLSIYNSAKPLLIHHKTYKIII